VASEEFDRELTVGAGAATAWAVLTDVERLTRWVGIVHDVVELSRLEKYTAVLLDKIGPFKLRADLDITANVLIDGREIEIRASGRDRALDSRIAVQAKLALTDLGEGPTSVRATGTYQVTGRVASMGGGVIRKKADRILEDFFGNAAKELRPADQH
jgi:carbon monoxide dehydrogenase subunit G